MHWTLDLPNLPKIIQRGPVVPESMAYVQHRVELRRFRKLHPIRSKSEPCLSIDLPRRSLRVQLTFAGLTAISLCGRF
jgi:hypothetical protein